MSASTQGSNIKREDLENLAEQVAQEPNFEVPEEISSDPRFHALVGKFARAVKEREVQQALPGSAPLERHQVQAGFCFQVGMHKESVGPPLLFVNVAHSPAVPDAQLPPTEQLVEALEDPNAAMRLPILIGELRQDKEGGKPCGVIEVCVGTKVIERARQDPIFRHAVALLSLDWIEDRLPEIIFDRDTIRMQQVPNRGNLGVQYKRHALVSEIDGKPTPAPASSTPPPTKAPSSTIPSPKPATPSLAPPSINIRTRSSAGQKQVVVDVTFERLKTSSGMSVEVDDERLYVDAGTEYHWSCRLPSDMDFSTITATFIKSKRILRIVGSHKRP